MTSFEIALKLVENSLPIAFAGKYYVYRYDIVYEQTVNTEDVFLGIGNKTPMTSSCNQLLVLLRSTLPTKRAAFLVFHSYFDLRL